MTKISYRKLSLSLACASLLLLNAAKISAEAKNSAAAPAATNTSGKQLKVNIVNFKTCVEQSKAGKHEQANFEALKKQAETVMEEKEKGLNEIATKFNDPDYLDSLSPEAEAELKHKFRTASQEINQLQNQYYQVLQQSNYKIVQKLTEMVSKAAANWAKDNKADLVLNEEGAFYYNPDLDVSKQVIAIMDEQFDKENNG